mgnify:FL=1
MSKYDSLELIISHTERQLKVCHAELAKLKEGEKTRFIPGEFVQCRDFEDENWMLGNYIWLSANEDYPHRVNLAGTGDASHKHCRLPKDVPGILIRHDGGDVCPVSNGGERVLVISKDDNSLRIIKAACFNWKYASHYVILPEHVK